MAKTALSAVHTVLLTLYDGEMLVRVGKQLQKKMISPSAWRVDDLKSTTKFMTNLFAVAGLLMNT